MARKGTGLLAKADIIINMAYQDEQRVIKLQAESTHGEQVMTALAQIIKL